jgi:sterol desaturase/sphingolipid hydroxylase (fatty acid hydroxylase superfamily)
METLRAFLAPLLPFFALYLSAMLAEWLLLYARSRGKRPDYEPGETATNTLSWMTAVVAWIPLNLLTFATGSSGSPISAPAAALAWDFSYYWQHRAEHRVRLLWAGHVTHHSSERFNYSNGLRQSWTPASSSTPSGRWSASGPSCSSSRAAGIWSSSSSCTPSWCRSSRAGSRPG